MEFAIIEKFSKKYKRRLQRFKFYVIILLCEMRGRYVHVCPIQTPPLKRSYSDIGYVILPPLRHNRIKAHKAKTAFNPSAFNRERPISCRKYYGLAGTDEAGSV